MLKNAGREKVQKKSYEEVKCPYCHMKFRLNEDNTDHITKSEKVIYCDYCSEEFHEGMCK